MRENFVVPRVSICPASCAATFCPKRLFSSPMLREIVTFTVSPRFFFESSATLTPPNSRRFVRASMFACVGSNASAADTCSLPLKSFITSAMVGAAGISARCGASSGRYWPTVRLSRR